MQTTEYNFDGIVGPNHNYAGLSPGNVASAGNAGKVANPKVAALQGLEKMLALHERGFAQAVFPPVRRPDLQFLHRLGFTGKPEAVLRRAWRDAPALAAMCFSASSMWAANAATVSAAADSDDGKLHLTAANLHTMLHRAIESPHTARMLQQIFPAADLFNHHEPLPACDYFADEGAANHTRLLAPGADVGVSLFVYGRSADPASPRPRRYPARQTLEACKALARTHGLKREKTVYAQQNPKVIDQGVFHNDVISVGSGSLLFCHEQAFLQQAEVFRQLQEAMAGQLSIIEVGSEELSVEQAVNSYLFNSQLLALPAASENPQYLLLAPQECEQNTHVRELLARLLDANNPLAEVQYFNLRQSMRNGGGPACLRLRVPLRAEQASAIQARVILDSDLYAALKHWIKQHYRDRLAPADLRDPALANEFALAHDALLDILRLPKA